MISFYNIYLPFDITPKGELDSHDPDHFFSDSYQNSTQHVSRRPHTPFKPAPIPLPLVPNPIVTPVWPLADQERAFPLGRLADGGCGYGFECTARVRIDLAAARSYAPVTGSGCASCAPQRYDLGRRSDPTGFSVHNQAEGTVQPCAIRPDEQYEHRVAARPLRRVHPGASSRQTGSDRIVAIRHIHVRIENHPIRPQACARCGYGIHPSKQGAATADGSKSNHCRITGWPLGSLRPLRSLGSLRSRWPLGTLIPIVTGIALFALWTRRTFRPRRTGRPLRTLRPGRSLRAGRPLLALRASGDELAPKHGKGNN